MIRMTSACPIGIQRDHGIAIKLHAFEQDATETLPLLERANEEGYKAASSDIFPIVALRLLRYIHDAMVKRIIK